MKYVSIFRTHFSERPFFTMRDASLFLRDKGASPSYVKVFIHSLVKKKVLFRLGKGTYSFHEELDLSGHAFRPFYYGLHSALTHHALWGQATLPVIITTRKVRPGIRTIWGRNIRVRRIHSSLFFGFDLVQSGNYWIPVSDVEKTFLDMIYFRQAMTRELVDAFIAVMDSKKLNHYLKRFPARVKKGVMKKMVNYKKDPV